MHFKIILQPFLWIYYTMNFIILGRYRVEIETPQFYGSQTNFSMKKQVGWLYLVTLKFKHNKKYEGHDIQFHSIEDAYKSVVKR